MANGTLIILTGASGAGKDVLVKELVELHRQDWTSVCSFTTRPPRVNRRWKEMDGVEHHFISPAQFWEMSKESEDREAKIRLVRPYCGHMYGVDVDEISVLLGEGRTVVASLGRFHAFAMRRRFGERTHLIYVRAEDDVIRKRIIARHHPGARELKERLDGTLKRIHDDLTNGDPELGFDLVVDNSRRIDFAVEEIESWLEKMADPAAYRRFMDERKLSAPFAEIARQEKQKSAPTRRKSSKGGK